MIEFKKSNTGVTLSYSSDMPSMEWVYHEIRKSGKVRIAKAFSFTKKELLTKFDQNQEEDPVEFQVATKQGEYFCFPKEILSIDHNLYIHEDIKLERKLFVAERGISVFRKINDLVSQPIYVGGIEDSAIPEATFWELLKAFPNTYELNRYASARISSVLSSYVKTKDDYEERYHKYLNKRVSREGSNLNYLFSEIELLKYQGILEKLNNMLEDENSYSEGQWQEELLQILLLLYPKYIHVFKEAPVRDTYSNTNRNIDYLLIDSSGNTDIVEIKKPFDKCIVTNRTYRDNYIPLRELSGTVMQIEKYIFYLNKWGKKGEDKLSEYFKDEISPGFKIKITNPSGIIIMGRTKGLTPEQVQDFEVIKRKYKSVIDIITYDDLVERLQFVISHWKITHDRSTRRTANNH
ncbi:Shedu immune nuclease family protein [Microbulbifer sp. MCCC 1A16149]|uniref:Shedu immune nuclease family protein n=1 Tax=Microbulbifer sp. MCCC 1A16149 TaxID=3411322 RepID=UPI003D142529